MDLDEPPTTFAQLSLDEVFGVGGFSGYRVKKLVAVGITSAHEPAADDGSFAPGNDARPGVRAAQDLYADAIIAPAPNGPGIGSTTVCTV